MTDLTMMDFAMAATSHDDASIDTSRRDALHDLWSPNAIDANAWLSWNWSEPMWIVPDLTLFPATSSMDDQYGVSSGEPASSATHISSNNNNNNNNNYHNNSNHDVCNADVHDGISDAIAHMISSKIDPVEHHRQTIFNHLSKQSAVETTRAQAHWLDRTYFPTLLRTYFSRHHRHTPVIHLPTFNIVDCPTFLVWAIALIAASYMPAAGLRAADTLALAKSAYTFTMETDQGLNARGQASLEALQALLLLSILDRLMISRSNRSSSYAIDLGRISRLARDANIFQEPERTSGTSPWLIWASMEARRR